MRKLRKCQARRALETRRREEGWYELQRTKAEERAAWRVTLPRLLAFFEEERKREAMGRR